MERLSCENLGTSFDSVQALAGITFEFPRAGIVAIIGPNGAGKTTLFNVLTGFVEPDAGRCFYNNVETTRLPPFRIAQMGITRTFQDLRFIRQVPVIENVLVAQPQQRGERLWEALVGETSADRRVSRERASEWLGKVGLQQKASVLSGELSHGEQKLLVLACCLASEGRVLLLDEPMAGLHPEIASRTLKLLAQLRHEGKLVVFIEHDITTVRLIADIIVVMDQGKIVAQGTPQEVLERPEILNVYLA